MRDACHVIRRRQATVTEEAPADSRFVEADEARKGEVGTDKACGNGHGDIDTRRRADAIDGRAQRTKINRCAAGIARLQAQVDWRVQGDHSAPAEEASLRIRCEGGRRIEAQRGSRSRREGQHPSHEGRRHAYHHRPAVDAGEPRRNERHHGAVGRDLNRNDLFNGDRHHDGQAARGYDGTGIDTTVREDPEWVRHQGNRYGTSTAWHDERRRNARCRECRHFDRRQWRWRRRLSGRCGQRGHRGRRRDWYRHRAHHDRRGGATPSTASPGRRWGWHGDERLPRREHEGSQGERRHREEASCGINKRRHRT